MVVHDKSTMQANDGEKKGWVLDGEQPLWKKGVGRGLHQSDVICSTYGWLKGANVTMKYGKNYDGYWTGELFVKQVCKFEIKTILPKVLQLHEKIIPEFKRLHGPGYQALIMVGNSQGHATYASNALLVTKINLNPGGPVPKLQDGWFMYERCQISQPMVFSMDHSINPEASSKFSLSGNYGESVCF